MIFDLKSFVKLLKVIEKKKGLKCDGKLCANQDNWITANLINVDSEKMLIGCCLSY